MGTAVLYIYIYLKQESLEYPMTKSLVDSSGMFPGTRAAYELGYVKY